MADDGTVIGGYIYPGGKSLIHGLTARTNLPIVEIEYDLNGIGTSTESCINYGVSIGTKGALTFLVSAAVDHARCNDRIIVTGGPLFIEDYKVVNPDLPDKALPNIKKKCERVINELKHQKWADKKVIFLYEKDNITDKLILNKRETVSKLIEKEIKAIDIGSWNEFED